MQESSATCASSNNYVGQSYPVLYKFIHLKVENQLKGNMSNSRSLLPLSMLPIFKHVWMLSKKFIKGFHDHFLKTASLLGGQDRSTTILLLKLATDTIVTDTTHQRISFHSWPALTRMVSSGDQWAKTLFTHAKTR